MNTLRFDESQVKAVGEVSVATQGEPGRLTIINSDQDWYVRAGVDFEAVPKETHEIIFDVYLESLGVDKDISGPEFSDGQQWSSQIRHYDFQVDVKKKSVPTGLYRISAVIRLLDKNRRNLAGGYSDGGTIEIYKEII